VAQLHASGKDKKAIKASLNRDSVFVLISAASITKKKINPDEKNGKGQ
jgi:hypothetical protein